MYGMSLMELLLNGGIKTGYDDTYILRNDDNTRLVYECLNAGLWTQKIN